MNKIESSLPIKGFWDTRQGGRHENQDYCESIQTPFGLLVIICDGMGGGPAGRLASTSAIAKIDEFIRNHEIPNDEDRVNVLTTAIKYAHQHILSLIDAKPSLQGMGTTVAAILVSSKDAILAHVGDTRIYQFRKSRSIFRTQDHSMVADLVRNGTLTEEQARLSAQSNLITRALGSRQDSRVDVDIRPYKKGDRFMICSDGIWGMRPEKELVSLASRSIPLEEIIRDLVEDTDTKGFNDGGHHDNLTIAMIETASNSIYKGKKKTKRNVMIACVVMLAIVVFVLWLLIYLNIIIVE